MIQSGIDLATIRSISEHNDATLILHYPHATRESREQSVGVLENFVVGEKKKAS